MDKKEIVFVTHNKGKIASAQREFTNSNVELICYEHDLDEPRTDDIIDIAKAKVKQAYEIVKRPCMAMDTGFFIEALNGFPRAFVNFALDTINIEGILKLMEGIENRKCYFGECLIYFDGTSFKEFYVEIPGELSHEKLGIDTAQKWSALWYVFKLKNSNLTLAQMDDKIRSEQTGFYELSTLKQFVRWYEKEIL